MANACVQSLYFSGQGTILVADRDVNGNPTGFVPVGNVSSLSINVDRTVFSHKESCSGVRAVDLELTQEINASLSMVMESLNKENLALALYGTASSVAAGSVVDEAVTARLDKWVPLAHLGVSAVLVTNSAGNITYVAGTHYEVNADAGSIMALSTGTITAAQALLVDYSFVAEEVVQTLTTGVAPIKWLRFEGLNTVDNKRVVIDIYKWSVAPLAELGVINDEIAQMTVEGAVLSDATKVSGSKFFRIRYEKTV